MRLVALGSWDCVRRNADILLRRYALPLSGIRFSSSIHEGPLGSPSKDGKGKSRRADLATTIMSIRDEDLSNMPLVDLVKLRPKQPYSAEGERFSSLFSMHPTIASITMMRKSPNDIAQAWSSLRAQTRTTRGILSKLTRSIDHHLKNMASKEIQDRVAAVWLNANRSQHIERDLGKRTPYSQLDPEMKALQVKRNAENRRRPKSTFEHYLDKHGIMIEDGMSAAAIEEKTRSFQHEITPRESSVTKLGTYLISIGFAREDIVAAMAARRLYLKREGYRKQYNRRRDALNSSSGINHSSESVQASSTSFSS